MRRVGFFRELPHGDPAGSILRDVVGATAPELAVRLVEYLEGGRLLAAVPALGEDVLDPTRRDVSPPHLLTDGRWVWPADLAYYVERYRVGVPDEFLADIEMAGWTIEVSDEQIEAFPRRLSRTSHEGGV